MSTSVNVAIAFENTYFVRIDIETQFDSWKVTINTFIYERKKIVWSGCLYFFHVTGWHQRAWCTVRSNAEHFYDFILVYSFAHKWKNILKTYSNWACIQSFWWWRFPKEKTTLNIFKLYFQTTSNQDERSQNVLLRPIPWILCLPHGLPWSGVLRHVSSGSDGPERPNVLPTQSRSSGKQRHRFSAGKVRFQQSKRVKRFRNLWAGKQKSFQVIFKYQKIYIHFKIVLKT